MGEKFDHTYFANRDCRYFPCHKGANGESFNCLFCYCPLYTLGDRCGGDFLYTGDGVKSCENCLLPHSKGGYEYILKKFPEIAELIKENK